LLHRELFHAQDKLIRVDEYSDYNHRRMSWQAYTTTFLDKFKEVEKNLTKVHGYLTLAKNTLQYLPKYDGTLVPYPLEYQSFMRTHFRFNPQNGRPYPAKNAFPVFEHTQGVKPIKKVLPHREPVDYRRNMLTPAENVGIRRPRNQGTYVNRQPTQQVVQQVCDYDESDEGEEDYFPPEEVEDEQDVDYDLDDEEFAMMQIAQVNRPPCRLAAFWECPHGDKCKFSHDKDALTKFRADTFARFKPTKA
jgi:hypothetical protein